MAEDLATSIPVGKYESNNDEYWLSKYLKCERNVTLKNEVEINKFN